MILCVRFARLVHRYFSSDSATDATLNTGDWLGLARQGLSPCKMHQAYLGALTVAFCGLNTNEINRIYVIPANIKKQKEVSGSTPHQTNVGRNLMP